MNFARNGIAWISSAGLFFIAMLLIATAAVVTTFSSADTVKSLLRDSGVYETAVETGLESLDETAVRKTNGEEKIDAALENTALASTKDELVPLLEKALPADFIEQSSEQVLDALFDWAEGKAPEPVFNINLESQLQQVLGGVGGNLKAQFAAAPVCTDGDAIPEGDFNPFEYNCRPADVNVETAIDTFLAQAVEDGSIIENARLSSENLGLTAEAIEQFPKEYQGLKNLPYFLIVAIVILTVFTVVIAAPHKRGWRYAGGALIFAGALSAVMSMLFDTSVSVVDTIRSSDSGVVDRISKLFIEDLGSPIADEIIRATSAASLRYGLVMVAIGLVYLFVPVLLRLAPERHRDSSDGDINVGQDASNDTSYVDEYDQSDSVLDLRDTGQRRNGQGSGRKRMKNNKFRGKK